MELDQKIRYVLFALSFASAFLAGLGIHFGGHLSVLDRGGRAD